jgi:agmatine deiminase
VNGAGTLLTTESCLLNANRNPSLSKTEIEQRLKEFLGVQRILWLGEGIAGDDTDGHIDDLARFVDTQTIVTVVERDPSDPNFAPLRDNLRRLQAMRDCRERSFNIIELPMPPPAWIEGQRTPCSYANFYISNQAVLVPMYRAPSDRVACEILQELFPGRKVIGIDCSDLVWGLGAIHCVTQQLPAIGARDLTD